MPGDWAKFGQTVVAAAGTYAKLPPVLEPPPLHGSHWWGSSDEFAREVRRHRQDLFVDEHDIAPNDGKPFWVPRDESTPPRRPLLKDQCGPPAPWSCDLCRDRIEPGSNLVCLNCQRSGYETRLAGQRKFAGRPSNPPAVEVAVEDDDGTIELPRGR